jgi:hypothetical protein
MSRRLGLIAGEGHLPVLVARGARAAGVSVVCASLGGFASAELVTLVDAHRSVGVMRVGSWTRFLRRHAVHEAILVGRIPKERLYAGGRVWRWFQFVPDVRTIRLYLRRVRRDNRDHAVLEAIADELASSGIRLIDSTTFVKDQLATPGVMTQRHPTPEQRDSASFGFELCRMLSSQDVGQAIALTGRDVIAVEAMEGTDAMIRRAGELCRTRGWVMIKTGNAKGDFRFDVPTVGLRTIEQLSRSGCGCLVLEAGQVLVLDKPEVIREADRVGLSIVGMGESRRPG